MSDRPADLPVSADTHHARCNCRPMLGQSCPGCDTGLYRLTLLRAALDAARDELADAVSELAHDRNRPISAIAAAAGMSRATVHGLIDPAYRRRRNAS